MLEFKATFPLFVGLILSAMTSGCAPSLSENPPREANAQVPEQFAAPSAAEQAAGKDNPKVPSVGKKTFRQFFDDPRLIELVEAALENNQELNIQLQELIIRQNEVRVKNGEYTPRLDAHAGAGLEKVGRRTSQGASDEAHGLPEPLGDFSFGLRASWEIDVWRKLRNASKAAQLRYLSSVQGRNFVVTAIVAEIANSYYELVALDSQLDVLERNIAIQQDALGVVRVQKEAAQVTELAVQRFEAELLKNKSRRFELEQRRVEAENRINFLVGRFPQPVERDPRVLHMALPLFVEAGVPSDLLENRPDVRQAQLSLQAAQLDVKSAKANFYPSLSIEAGVGYESFNARHLVATPESLLYNLAGNLTAPLLNRAAIKAEYRNANARQLQAVYDYERTILRAFTEVVNELSRIQKLKESYELESRQVELLSQAIEVSAVLFQSARADYMEVLLTRRDSLQAEMELIETRRSQIQALIDVYQALGGGWR